MKKIMKVFVLVAAAAMALVSCQKPEVDNPAPQEYEYTFLLGSADTKAVIGENSVEWENGDQIGIYAVTTSGVSANKYGAVTPGAPAKMVVYSEHALTVGDMVYAYFPRIGTNADTPDAVKMSIPSAQDGKNDMPMVSLPLEMETEWEANDNETSASGLIKFCNVGSVIEFNVYSTEPEYRSEKIQSVSFIADKSIAGDFEMNMEAVDGTDATLAVELTNGSKEVVFTLSTPAEVPAEKSSAAKINMVVAPGTYTGNIVVTTDKATYTYPISAAKEFKRSAVHPLGLNLRENVREENTSSEPVEVTATLTFDANKANRTEYSTSKQVWEQNGIKLTNDKASSTTNVGDYSNPARFYKSSTIKIEAPGNITKIVFNSAANESDDNKKYLDFLKTAVGNNVVDGTKVTVELDGTSSSVTYTMPGQVRLYDITVTYLGEAYVPPTIVSLEISGYKTEFIQDETFSFGGVVTATYDDGSTRDVTKLATVSEPNMSEVGTQRVTVTYEGKIATYDITIEEKPADAKAWTLVTDASTLNAGDQVVIVAKDSNYALSTTQNNNNRGQASVVKSGNNITFGSDVQVLTLQAGQDSGTFAFYTGAGYLYAASSSKNYLKTENTLSKNSSWKITITSAGVATIVAQGTNTRNVMQYNQSSSLFACYSSASQKAIAIYRYE